MSVLLYSTPHASDLWKRRIKELILKSNYEEQMRKVQIEQFDFLVKLKLCVFLLIAEPQRFRVGCNKIQST